MNSIFKEGQVYTIYTISEFMATTVKKQFKVKGFQINKFGGMVDVIFQPIGKRKLFILPAKTRAFQTAPVKDFGGAIFEGLDQPFLVDSETSSFCGNACYNFIGNSEEIKKWINDKQLNPNFDKSVVVAKDNEKEVVVYPELNKGNHAVISRILEKQLV